MITHIVFFRLKDTSPDGLMRTKKVLMNMDGQIPVLKHIEVGLNVVASERAYDVALVTRFNCLEDLNAYQVHPEHLQVAAFIKEAVREPSVAIDYES
ncbi:MAG: Dabb family protein [Gorillibacterium sp.]|nr:Dabb family protein [Gorillibacterium sp.]